MKSNKTTFSFISRPVFFILAFLLFTSHDLYIKMDTYFLELNQEVTLRLFNGTFEESENTIARDRMLDASIVYNGKRLPIQDTQWTDKDSTVTQFRFTPEEEGTYVTGVSTKARNIELTAEKFNDYLVHDGVLDMLEDRKANNRLDQDAVESYQKHVKAIYQVGDKRSDDWKRVLGYPIEFVPVENPYDKYTGETLEVQLLLDGQPLSNQLVYADHIKGAHAHQHEEHAHEHVEHSHPQDAEEHTHDEHSSKKDTHTHEHEHEGKTHSHEHNPDDKDHTHSQASKPKNGHTHTQGEELRTNENGIVTLSLPEDGIYYLRTIHMVNLSDREDLTHESKWATLTFEVTHKHGEDTHMHDHDHEHEEGIPTWLFILASLLVIVVLFFVFRKKS